MNVKFCKVCRVLKPASEFYPERRSRDGLTARCKACKRVKETPTQTQPQRVSDLEPVILRQGETMPRPSWHAWVYGGSKNLLVR